MTIERRWYWDCNANAKDQSVVEVCVEVVNSTEEFKWRLIVNGDASCWNTDYRGILTHLGYAVCSAYWEGVLPIREMVPFKFGAPLSEKS